MNTLYLREFVKLFVIYVIIFSLAAYRLPAESLFIQTLDKHLAIGVFFLSVFWASIFSIFSYKIKSKKNINNINHTSIKSFLIAILAISLMLFLLEKYVSSEAQLIVASASLIAFIIRSIKKS